MKTSVIYYYNKFNLIIAVILNRIRIQFISLYEYTNYTVKNSNY